MLWETPNEVMSMAWRLRLTDSSSCSADAPHLKGAETCFECRCLQTRLTHCYMFCREGGGSSRSPVAQLC